jgi:hypothetical protein
MDDSTIQKTNPSPAARPQSADLAVVVLALLLYVLERYAAFVFLEWRTGSGGSVEAQLLGFFFGQPPYSLLDILLGFDSYQGLFGLPVWKYVPQVIIQGMLFLTNAWIISFCIYYIGKLSKLFQPQKGG